MILSEISTKRHVSSFFIFFVFSFRGCFFPALGDDV